MSDPITARYVWDPEELTEAWAAHYRHSSWPAFRALLWLILAIYMVTSVGIPLTILARVDSPPESKRGAVLALFVALGFWTFLIVGARRRTFLRWRARRTFRSIPGGAKLVGWTLGPDQVTVQTDLVASTLLWASFLKVVETPKGFMLYQQARFFNWIPGHAFRSEGEMRRFADLARERASRFVFAGECRFAGKAGPAGPDEL